MDQGHAIANESLDLASVELQAAMREGTNGMGTFLHKLFGIDPLIATTFGAMALSTFIFDILDAATRLGRYILQELASAASHTSAAIATFVTCAIPTAVLLAAGQNQYRLFWNLFGTSNQLLAGLSHLSSPCGYADKAVAPGSPPFRWFLSSASPLCHSFCRFANSQPQPSSQRRGSTA
jgi:carbon starvation protein CstA